jgi:uncharacterized protein
MGSATDELSLAEARRLALAAQGFGRPRPAGRVDTRQLRRIIDQLGVLQLDSVNVVCRSHYLPVFARLGPYPRGTLDRLSWGAPGDRALFEYWGHQASLLPLRLHPLLRWRMRAAQRQAWGGDLRRWRGWLEPGMNLAPWAVISGMSRIAVERPELVDEVLALIVERGPVTAATALPDGQPRGDGSDFGTGTMWNWRNAKIVLEWLFYLGTVTTATRRGFERVYDLTERVLPAEVLATPTPAPEDAQRELVRTAARAYGVATERELRRYFHLPAAESKVRVRELVDAGELAPVRLEGGSPPVYRWTAAPAPAPVRARALLSPFDSLIWDRDRMARLFDFQYRISIYTPAAKRVHGFYVMPFLLGKRLVARVDVRADRQRSVLLVPAAHAEPGMATSEVAAELAEELRLMAGWLELDRVQVGDRGDLAPALTRA